MARRGRPARGTTARGQTTAAGATPRRRGRPPKAASAATATTNMAVAELPRRRGRPPKAVITGPPKGETILAPRRRGRPPKAASGSGPKAAARPRVARKVSTSSASEVGILSQGVGQLLTKLGEFFNASQRRIQELEGQVHHMEGDLHALQEEREQVLGTIRSLDQKVAGEAHPKRRGRPPKNGVAHLDATELKGTPKPRVAVSEETRTVVLSTIREMGNPTAREVAEKLGSEKGLNLTGRSVRWIAERAGAEISKDAAGQQRYQMA